MPRRLSLPREEINRKLLHFPALILPVGIFYFPRWTGMPKWAPAVLIGILLLLSIGLETLRFSVDGVQRCYWRCFGPLLRSEERHRITGSTTIIAAAFLCALLFMDTPHIAFMALTAFVLGDAGAALVGIGFGRLRIGTKTLEGAVACFLTALVAFSLYPFLPDLLETWGGELPPVVRLGAPAIIALIELIPFRIGRRFPIDDNLVAPVLTGLALQYLHSISA
jgi:dolichol kinase